MVAARAATAVGVPGVSVAVGVGVVDALLLLAVPALATALPRWVTILAVAAAAGAPAVVELLVAGPVAGTGVVKVPGRMLEW